ncbi:MAG: hypothetical protein U0163_20635 [Gemmatimonadaceae bacterium]
MRSTMRLADLPLRRQSELERLRAPWLVEDERGAGGLPGLVFQLPMREHGRLEDLRKFPRIGTCCREMELIARVLEALALRRLERMSRARVFPLTNRVEQHRCNRIVVQGGGTNNHGESRAVPGGACQHPLHLGQRRVRGK